MGVDSGLPDFRGTHGFWRAYPVIAKLGLSFAEISHRTEAQYKRFTGWLNELAKSSAKLALVELGAGSAIPTVRLTSEQVVQRIGGTLVRINPREADVPSDQIGLPFAAAEGIRRILDCAKGRIGGQTLRPPPLAGIL